VNFIPPARVRETGSVLYCKPLNTETFSVRLDRSAKTRLQKLAKNTGRSRSFLAAEAISAYLDTNEWQISDITHALASLDRGKGIARARVSDWVASWETRKERRSPRGV
jgi:predicted transcriptional regulator